MLKKDKKSIDNKYFKKQIILVLIIIIYILSLSFISGRYILKEINTYLSASKEFYFYSDKLYEEETEYHINWSGNEACIIPINLYTKLNSLKTAKHDIKYKVEYILLSNNASCELSKEEGVVSSINNTDAFSLSVTPNGNIDVNENIEVKVIVSTIDDFERILTAKFVITMNSESVLYKIDDEKGRAYFNLIISNSQEEEVTIEFDPNEVIIDTTNSIFEDLGSYTLLSDTRYFNKVVFTAKPRSNINIKFFKKDVMQNYTNSNSILSCEFQKI